MIAKFLEYIKVEKRYSENTILSYKKDLETLVFFLKETEGTEDTLKVDKKIVRNFIAWLSQNQMSKRSINRKLSSLRSYFLFLVRIGEIKSSPLETIQSLKFYPEKQRPMSEEEMEKVVQIVSEEENLLEGLIMEILYQTGIRRAELCGLLLENVNFHKNELKIIGKGNKTRLVPISEKLSQWIEKYIKEERKPIPEAENYLLLTPRGKKLYEKFVYSVVNSYLSRVTLKDKKSPHMLRHSFATHILNNGAEISKVKSLMGHSSLSSTQVYTHADIEQLKKVFKDAHPRSKDENKSNP